MKKRFELTIAPDGTIGTIYQKGLEKFAKDMGGEVAQVCRASNVEFEVIGRRKGWSVRSAKRPEFAIRITDERGMLPGLVGNIILFQTREEALKMELKFFRELNNGKGSC